MVLLRQLGQGIPAVPGFYNSSKQFGIRNGTMPTNAFLYSNLITKKKSKAESKLAYAHKHSLAERDRRKRINKQFDKLRSILPNLTKMDKASVLTQTVRGVKDLQKKVEALKAASYGRLEQVIPSETDGLSLVQSGIIVKATFSCEERPDLVSDLTGALKSVTGRVVRAEMVTVGGRFKGELLVQGLGGNEGMRVLKRALQTVLDRPSSS